MVPESVQDLGQAHACKIGYPSLPLVFLRLPYALEILAALILAATKMAGLLMGSLPPGAASVMPPLAKATKDPETPPPGLLVLVFLSFSNLPAFAQSPEASGTCLLYLTQSL